MAEIRLQRFLAQAGVASRRKAETLIAAGHVSVNGRVIRELGTRVDPRRDRVTVDGRRVLQQDHVWIVLHKPPNSISSTHDPEGRETVLDLVRIPNTRLYPVGRLDWATSGVLLLTNDGLLAEQLLHPRHEIPRTYHVKVKGIVRVSELERLREGILLESGHRATCEVSLLASTGIHTWLEMTIHQGINHQIHRMLEAIEREVLKLIRVSFAGIRVDDLPPGKYRALTQREVNELRNTFGLEGETRRVTAKDLGGRRQPRTRRPRRNDDSPSSRTKTKSGSRNKTPERAHARASSERGTTRKPATSKQTTRKPATSKQTTRKPASKKSGRKPAVTKQTTRKPAATKQTSRKPTTKKPPSH